MALFQVLGYSLAWVGERYLSEHVAKNKCPSEHKVAQEAWKNYGAVIVALRFVFSFLGLLSGSIWVFGLTLGYFPGIERYTDAAESYQEMGFFATLLLSRFIGYFIFAQIQAFQQEAPAGAGGKPDKYAEIWVTRAKTAATLKPEVVGQVVGPLAEAALVVLGLLFRPRHLLLFEVIDIIASAVEIVHAQFFQHIAVDIVLVRHGLSLYLLLVAFRYAGWAFLPFVLFAAAGHGVAIYEKLQSQKKQA
jgi:hypothetical protein